MKFISTLITFFLIFNINSISYSSILNEKNDIMYSLSLDENIYFEEFKNNNLYNLSNDSNIINFDQIIIGSYIPFLLSHIMVILFVSMGFVSFYISGLYVEKDSNRFNSSIFNAISSNSDTKGSVSILYSLYYMFIFSILSGTYISFHSDKNFNGNRFLTIMGAFIGTLFYFISFNSAVILESKLSDSNKSFLGKNSMFFLLIFMPIFTSTFATIFYNLSKKPKEKILTEVDIIEEQRKIQESLLSSLNNIQVNRGNIEYKVLSF